MMTFSASLSVVEFYLLKRFPIPYGSFQSFIYGFIFDSMWYKYFEIKSNVLLVHLLQLCTSQVCLSWPAFGDSFL